MTQITNLVPVFLIIDKRQKLITNSRILGEDNVRLELEDILWPVGLDGFIVEEDVPNTRSGILSRTSGNGLMKLLRRAVGANEGSQVMRADCFVLK